MGERAERVRMSEGEGGRGWLPSATWGWLLACAAVAALVVLWLGVNLAEGRRWSADATILLAVQSSRAPALDALMVAVSYIGFTTRFLPLILLVGAALWRWRGRGEAMLVVLSTGGAYAVSLLIKEAVRRPRPSGADIWTYGPLADYSFPSMHVVTYVVFFGLLAYLAAVRWRGQAYRWPVLAVSVLAIALVGLSRVYLGAHWPSDVLGGYLVGYCSVVLCVYLFQWRGRQVRAEQA